MGKLIFKYTAMLLSLCTTATTFAEFEQPTDSLTTDSIMPLSINAISADVNSSASPEKLYKTPEAKAFMEYGRFSSEASNGSIDISIPIHTISCRDLNIPISLHYSGKGIKVAEEASWVGLGWDLSVGGCINYVPAGEYDYLVRNAQWSDYLQALNQKSQSVFQFQAYMSDYTVMEDLVNGMGERDFYSVNIMGRGFLFFINPYDDKPTPIGAADTDYSITPLGTLDYVNSPTKITGWRIKDTMGFEYEFSTIEYNTYEGAGKHKSAWYLSSIETPEGISASFSYEVSYVRGIPKPYQWYYAQSLMMEGFVADYFGSNHTGSVPTLQNVFGSGSSYTDTEIEKPWLKSISTSNQTVTFETSARTDMRGARKLDRIKVKNIDGSIVGHHHFNYGTFTHSTIGGSCPNTNSYLISDSRNGERLKLSGLSEMSIDGTDSLSYTFTYNETYPLPLKTSAAVDFWGYYNGQENITLNSKITDSRSLIPSLLDCTIGYSTTFRPLQDNLAEKGACRFSDSEKILSGTLSSITYPTGGKSVFYFEPHRFRSSPVYPLRNVGYKDIQTSVEDVNYPSTSTSPGPTVNRQVNVAKAAKGFLTVIFEAKEGKKLRDLQRAGASVTIQPIASPTYSKVQVTLDSCASVDLESTIHKQVFPVTLSPISYMFIANLPSSIPYGAGWIKATLEFRELDDDIISGGAGLRIAAVNSYDDDGSLTGRREFDYNDTDGKTSGKLIVGERATECRYKYLERVMNRNIYGEIDLLGWSKNQTIRINSSLSGGPAVTGVMTHGPVAYSHVTEKELDGKGNLIRSTVSEFYVRTAIEPYEDLHLLLNLGGGELLRRSVLDSSGKILQTEEFQYVDKQSRTIKCNLSAEDQYLEYVYDAKDLLSADALKKIKTPRYLVNIYPYVSFWRVLSGITTREHTPQGIIESRKTFAYNDSNRLVSEENMTSGSTGIRTTYKYSVDYPSTLPYSRMILSPYYVRGIPVETTSYELNGGTYTEARKEKLTYSFNATKADMLHLTRIDGSVAGGTLQTSETFTYSDTDGTLVGTAKNTADKMAYLWSYDHTCPVAVIDGASYSEVESWVGSSFVKTLSSAKTGIESHLSQLRTMLKDKGVMLTTYTYRPLVGITSQTGPTGEKITYEYDGFNRLTRVTDHNGKVIETYSYTYR